jgi:hypothetical protein
MPSTRSVNRWRKSRRRSRRRPEAGRSRLSAAPAGGTPIQARKLGVGRIERHQLEHDARVASAAEATSVAAAVERELLEPGGIVATPVVTGQQWDAPNGWAPLQWIAVEGLRSFGLDRLAETIACRFMLNVERVYRETRKLVEKYDVIDATQPGGGGEYPTQDGFGWTKVNNGKRVAPLMRPTRSFPVQR